MAVVALEPPRALVAKAAVCAGAVINTFVETLTFGDAVMYVLMAVDLLADVEMIVMVAVAFDWESARTASYSVDLLSVAVVDELFGAMAGATVGVLPEMGVDGLADVNAYVVAPVMTAL